MGKRHPQAFVESGDHLPKEFRDFHDQKDLFKLIHSSFGPDAKIPNWVDAHVYMFDYFLWFMGKRGYVLKNPRPRWNSTICRAK